MEVKWIKIATNIFDDEKLLLIENLPEADAIIVIWFKLLCMAGKQNNNGIFMLNDKIAYTEEMLATIFRKPLNIVRLALKTFESFGMVEIVDKVITIPNWEKHQNIDGLDKIREQTRKRVAAHREKQKRLIGVSKCAYCGENATGVDHIVATSRGGSEDENNKVSCCIRCNRIKNDKPLVDFLNSNREIIKDDLIASNEKLKNYVTLHNATNRYVVTNGNAIEKEEEIEKNKKDKFDKKDKPFTNDFCLNNLTQQLIKRNFISEGDLDLFNYNNFFSELLLTYDYELICKVVNYVMARMKTNEGIENKFGYFKTSVLTNINNKEALEEMGDDPFNWLNW